MRTKCEINYIFILIFVFSACFTKVYSQVLSNNATIVVPENAFLSVTGDLINRSSGDLNLNGVIKLKGNWINYNDGLEVGGEIRFVSNPGQEINGPETTTFKDVTIIAGSKVILGECIFGCKYVTITGIFTNENGESGFILKPGASLLHQSPEVAASIEQEFIGDEWAWHMLSSPVSAQNIEAGFDDGGFYAWHEPAQTWVNYSNTIVWPTWGDVNNPVSTFNIGKGYMTAYPYNGDRASPQTKTFMGHMNQGQVSFNLQRLAHPNDAYEGFNLLGNPYPSSIDWKAESGWGGRDNLQTPDSTSNPAGYNMWVWNDVVGNYGAHNSASISDYFHNGVSRYIPPMQAFWVRAENHGSSMTMDNNVRLHTNQEWLKSHKETPDVLQLAVNSDVNRYSDEIIIEFGHQTDRGGAQKMFSMYQEAPGLYSKKYSENWSINFLTSISEHPVVPLGFRAGANAFYTISSSGTGFFEEVTLEDLHSGILHDLSQYSSYHFSAEPGDPQDRFLLHFMTVGTDIHSLVKASVYYNNSILHVFNPWNENISVQLFDASGRFISRFNAPSKGLHRFGFKPQPGIYLVRMMGEKKVYTDKIIVL
ncbi:MAG: T9SS type A sorting domain-containing protein [Bacteroidales bacterium]|nr:T9SS type A sorting domain-containing protein [Bacteroidales bacterium]